MVENDSIGWYVAKTYRQERKIKDLLARMGIEHFVPFHQVVKEINGKRKKVERFLGLAYKISFTKVI